MAAALLLLVACFSPVSAHIHSHKVALTEGDKVSLETWVLALVSSVLVAAAGIFPLLLNRYVRLDDEQRSGLPLRVVLHFAVGGLLGDVFLHLLPEAWGPVTGAPGGWQIGVWVLFGLVSFLLVEKLANSAETGGSKTADTAVQLKTVCNGHTAQVGAEKRGERRPGCQGGEGERDVRGYLNLAANCTDNFTHGLAIAASYVAGPTVGILTTIAILCHEIPHEVGDFAILLSSGFDTRSAAKAQAITATGGLVGVVAGLTAAHLSSTSSWLLPFTAGGFLYIALVSIVPQLLDNDPQPLQSLGEIGALLLGIVVMAMVSMVEKQSCKHLPPHLAS